MMRSMTRPIRSIRTAISSPSTTENNGTSTTQSKVLRSTISISASVMMKA